MRFFLGSHKAQWLADDRFADVPLFISRRQLTVRKKLPRATGPWALDSGGFTELQMFGKWVLSPEAYVAEVRRFSRDVGSLAWAAPQDWMCEPIVLRGGSQGGGKFRGTGLSIEEHQRRTVENFLDLRALAPEMPFVPVLQGWSLADYWRCIDLYQNAGVDLASEATVGIGTMCRRQSTREANRILATVASSGIRLHGFGFKLQGLSASAEHLASADSLAWSYHARRRPPLEGHDRPGDGRRTGHRNCANCADYALYWHGRVLATLAEGGNGGGDGDG